MTWPAIPDLQSAMVKFELPDGTQRLLVGEEVAPVLGSKWVGKARDRAQDRGRCSTKMSEQEYLLIR
jgi:hypothetical protein